MIELPIWVVVAVLALAVLVAFIAIVVAVCCRGEADEWRRKFMHLACWLTENKNDPYCLDLKKILVCDWDNTKTIYSNEEIPFIKTEVTTDWYMTFIHRNYQMKKGYSHVSNEEMRSAKKEESQNAGSDKGD